MAKGVNNVLTDVLSKMDADFDKEEPDEGYAQVCAHVFSSKHYDESVDIPSGKNAEAIAKEQESSQ